MQPWWALAYSEKSLGKVYPNSFSQAVTSSSEAGVGSAIRNGCQMMELIVVNLVAYFGCSRFAAVGFR